MAARNCDILAPVGTRRPALVVGTVVKENIALAAGCVLAIIFLVLNINAIIVGVRKNAERACIADIIGDCQ